MLCFSTFLLSMSMVSGHTVKALWLMTSPMKLSTDTCYDLFMRFVHWNSGLPSHLVIALCKIGCCSSFDQFGGPEGFCILLVWPIMLYYPFFTVSWKPLFCYWTPMRLDVSLCPLFSASGCCWTLLVLLLLFDFSGPKWIVCSQLLVAPAMYLDPFVSVSFCAIWKIVALVLALLVLLIRSLGTHPLGLLGCWIVFGICWILPFTGLCVTSSFALWPPPASVVVFLVYDKGHLWQGLFETISIALTLFNGLFSVTCWPVLIAASCLHSWFLSYYTATYIILSSLFSLIYDVNSLFWSGPSPFLFFLELFCWVWSSVFQPNCLFFSSPGSDHGVLPLVCCWEDILFFGLWLFLWLSVTSCCQLGQPKLEACLAMACGVMEYVDFYSEATVCSSPLLLGSYWHLTCCYLRVMLRLLLPPSVFCPDYIFGFLLSYYDLFRTYLSRIMVRDDKMRILRSKDSLLPGSCAYWYSTDTFFMHAVLDLDLYFLPWLALCPVLLTWTVRNEAALHSFEDSMLFRSLLSSHSIWLLPRSAELRQGIFVDHLLQRITPLRSLLFYLLDCIVVVSSWTKLDCNKVFCMFFRISWGDMYVLFRLISMHITVLNRVLSTVVKRYGIPFNCFLSSSSMVRGHKAQVLWPVASPLTLLSGHYYSCIVKHMVWITLFLLWYGCHGLLIFLPCGWYLFSYLSLKNLPIRFCMELRQFKDLLNDTNLQNTGSNDSFESLSTIIGQFHPIFSL